VPARRTFAETFLAHQALLSEFGAQPVRVDDPLTSYVKTEKEWAERLVAEEKLLRDGDELQLSPKLVVTIFVQTLKALVLG
jgi:hypothetical protein